MATQKAPAWLTPKFSLPIGTKVRFILGVTMQEATVVEDRGVIRKGLRHLYRLEFERGEETISFELPESDFEVVPADAAARAA